MKFEALLLLLLPCAPDPFTYCGGDASGFAPGVPAALADDDAPAGKGAADLTTGSTKKSDGENASGLLWCGGESPLWFERATDGAFLRTGRIHGGRVALAGASSRCVSRGMLVTR
jgi:hypothetical protein